MKAFTRGLMALVMVMFTSACIQDAYTGENKAARAGVGAGVGAGLGAAIGALAGGNNKRKAALIGAGIGAVLGGGVGAYMDAQERQLRAQLRDSGVSVTRAGDRIILNMPGNVTFDSGSDQLQPQFGQVLDSVALVLEEYNKTYVDVIGHTDSTGSDQLNQALSERRASTVASYLQGHGVEPVRFVIRGAGEDYPIATNDTPDGRALNRRVEIGLTPVT